MIEHIHTKRFILREINESDIDGIFELDSDFEVHKYLGNNPIKSKNQAIDIISNFQNQYTKNGIGRLAIFDKATNTFIGWCGIKFITEKTNTHDNYYDLGYRIIKKHWGQGIAKETSNAILKFGFENLKLEKIYAIADCENEVSNAILVKLGFNFIETFNHFGINHNWYEIKKEDFIPVC